MKPAAELALLDGLLRGGSMTGDAGCCIEMIPAITTGTLCDVLCGGGLQLGHDEARHRSQLVLCQRRCGVDMLDLSALVDDIFYQLIDELRRLSHR